MSNLLWNRYATRIKNMDWIDGTIRRNPLYYNRMVRVFNWLCESSLAERKHWAEQQAALTCAKAAKTQYGIQVKGKEAIESWPFLNKEEVRKHPKAFMNSSSLISLPASTSGTTGMPLQLSRSPFSIVVEQLSIDLLIKRKGIDFKTANSAILKGDSIKDPSDMTPPYWKYSMGGKRLIFSSNHLSEATVNHYREALEKHSPDYVIAYPTSLESLSNLMLRKNMKLDIPLAVTSSEMLTARARESIVKAFNCDVVEYYGQSERVAFAYSLGPNEFYFLMGYAYVELDFITTEQNMDYYEIIGTPLWNSAMPLIRYRTGDLIQVPKGATAMELERIRYGLDPFLGIVGRTEDWYLDSPEGIRLMGIPHIARDAKNIVQMQIIQERLDYVRFLIIPTPEYSKQDEVEIIHSAYDKLPKSIQIDINIVDSLLKTKHGKTPFVIRKWETTGNNIHKGGS